MLPFDVAARAEPRHQDNVRILTRGQGSSREGRRRLVYTLSASSRPMDTVRHHSANSYHVPWEWCKYGTSDNACKGFLRKDALQCDDGFLSQVSSPCVCMTSISQCARYGLPEGSPSATSPPQHFRPTRANPAPVRPPSPEPEPELWSVPNR